MKITELRWLGLAAALVALPFSPANAQEYPSKVVRIVVPFPAGSATDGLARVIGQSMQKLTGQSVVVDNRSGANGMFAGDNIARSAPDGYSFLIGTHTTQSANRWLFKNMPYDARKDFQPVTALAKGWALLVVNAKSPIKSVKELVEKAKNAPGTVTYGGGGATSRIAVEQFAQSAGIKVSYVAYRGNPQAVQDLLGGQLDFVIVDTPTVLSQVEAGLLRALAFTGAERSPMVPNVPTIAEAGIKGYEYYYWQAAYLPAHTPEPIVKKLNEILHKASESDIVKNHLRTTGVVPFLTTPQELARFQEEQAESMGKVIREAGIEPQ